MFRDAGNDGPTAGEPGVAGVTVTLTDVTTTRTTTTDSQGNYAFVGVAPGSYTVTVTVPAGFQINGPLSRPATVTSGVGAAGLSFELAPKDGALGDLVFNDLNGNGTQDTGEPGLQGATVTVSQGGTTVATATSAADGTYLVTGLVAGDYTVAVTSPAGFVTTTTTPLTLPVTSGATNGTADFGAQQRNASLGDEVYVDTNGNGLRDAGEPLYTAALTLTLGGAATATTTSSAGLYLFDDLAAGAYTVTLTPPTGYRASTTLPLAVTLASGQNLRNADLGLEPIPGALSGTVFTDQQADGLNDAGDTPVAGQDVVVTARRGPRDHPDDGHRRDLLPVRPAAGHLRPDGQRPGGHQALHPGVGHGDPDRTEPHLDGQRLRPRAGHVVDRRHRLQRPQRQRHAGRR